MYYWFMSLISRTSATCCGEAKCLLSLQRQGPFSTFCDKPKRIRTVCRLWRHHRPWHSVRSHRVLQEKPHWTIQRVSDVSMFWGETEPCGLLSLSDANEELRCNRVLLLQTLNEELYDTIQVKEKTLTAVGAAKNTQTRQANSAAEQLPTRPLKSHRTIMVSKVC